MNQLFVIDPYGVGRTTLCKKLANVEQKICSGSDAAGITVNITDEDLNSAFEAFRESLAAK